MRRLKAMLLLGLAWLATPAGAQEVRDLTSLPGYFPVEHLDVLPAGDAEIEINLQGAMLRMISAFTGDEDPEFARLVEALDAIRVRSGSVAPDGLAELRRRIRAGRSWLDEHGWLTMVRVQEDGEEVYVYTRELEGLLVGMTVLALEEDEVTAVNLVGRIDPALLVHMARSFDLEALGMVEERLEETTPEVKE